ncbi:MAG: DEAD/DEAH box helicase, partial [Rhodobacteraceae bacterium]|nr:DEAD/DEAH box helicase [Paracoccaceae bacterium]
MRLDIHDIREVIGDRSLFRRGRTLYKNGTVLDIKKEPDNVLIGRVRDRTNIYYVDIQVEPIGEESVSVSGFCTCDLAYNCEHVAAVLLSHSAALRKSAHDSQFAHERHDSTGTSRESKLPGHLEEWLDTFDDSDMELFQPEPSGPSVIHGDAIMYLFRRSCGSKAEICPFKVYVKKDGELGKNVHEVSFYSGSHARKGMTHEDVAICAQLSYFGNHHSSQGRSFPKGAALKQFLQQIVSTGRARYDSVYTKPLHWQDDIKVVFGWKINEDGKQSLEAQNENGQQLGLLPFPDPVIVDPHNDLIGFAGTDLPTHTVEFLARAPVVPPESAGQLAVRMKNQFGSLVPPPHPVKIIKHTDLKPNMLLTLTGQTGEFWRNGYQQVTYPCIRANVTYDGHKSLLTPCIGKEIRCVVDQTVKIMRRDQDTERQMLEQLYDIVEPYGGGVAIHSRSGEYVYNNVRDTHVIFPAVQHDNLASMRELISFMSTEIAYLKEELRWEIEVDPEWPVKITDADLHFRTEFTDTDDDWFSLTFKLEVDGIELDLIPAIRQLTAGLPLDERGRLDEDFDLDEFLHSKVFYHLVPGRQVVPLPGKKMQGFVEAFLEIHGVTKFHRADAAQVWRISETLDGCGAKWVGGQSILDLGKRLYALARTKGDIQPNSLTADLRPYQQQGYGWLKALSESGFGGILADDMGLGKTVQALALLTHCHVEQKAMNPSLLVVPTSLVSNWQKEAARFAPRLKFLNLHGKDRHERFQSMPDYDLVLTTYPLIHRDQDELFAHRYELAILDEAQAVKNPAARTAKLIRNIEARQRIALTGTPLENNLMELWALFDWLIPGFLGDRKRFGKEFRRPIEKLGDGVTQERLSNRVKPFLLRRTKDDVLEELPPKTIIDETVSLGSGQAQLYESVRAAMDKRVREAVEKRGFARSRITVLDALLKLRQVCCDPQLVKLTTAVKVKESAKRARLNEMIEQLMSENRKVLVFSQFVEMLRLIERDVQDRGWTYAMLHGSTRNREAEIDKFQSGDSQLFLISLKAGGVGLNLTAADTVILYDPWWNPAVERQAMDRTHRIGQDKAVFVYRLFCKDTVETAIQAMQEKKQALADALFEGGASSTLSLTEEDLA